MKVFSFQKYFIITTRKTTLDNQKKRKRKNILSGFSISKEQKLFRDFISNQSNPK